MGRWEPDAAGRLRRAAMQLYVERGYDQTTVADIAQLAGLTPRTFFRHFADKREVLFAGAAILHERMVHAVDAAPAGAAPLTAVAAALDAAAGLLGGDRSFSRHRQDLIVANRELLERELVKLASLAAALADGLRRRGVPEPQASLAAEAGIAVLRVAFDRWLSEPAERPMGDVMRECLDGLSTVLTG